MNLNDRLRELRQKSGLTQEQVAERLGVTRQTISSYESGRTEPGLDILRELAKIYNADVSEILGENQFSQTRINKLLRKTAMVSAILFLVSVLLGSAFQWSLNMFIPMDVENLETRTRLWEIRDFIWGVGNLVLWVCSVVLIGLEFSCRRKVSVISKMKWVGILAAGTFLATIPFGLTDKIYTLPDYIISPLVSLALCLVITAVGHILLFMVRKK